ncbi:MAG: AhpC/TSA family protein [Saprospiraceae bacterium]|jgi:peroxiredoxin|nr:AhpC/TSA family protein [Saprospiraceae bacterium]MBP6566616.1 AhpC/TSA family protein [Saprospiraceae bacterium]
MVINRQNLSLIKTNRGNSISDLSDQSPVLLVFLRHFGCVFCKESLHDISKKKEKFVSEGIKIVLVHMSDIKTAESYFKKYGIDNVEHVSDPECKYYAVFGLVKGSFSQLFGLKTWLRGFEIAATKQVLPGTTRIGDGFQMPGIFLLKDSNVIESFIHNSVADKPDYESFIDVCHLD